MEELISKYRNKLIGLCRCYHVSRLEVFGSAAVGGFNPQTSDIDFLVEFDESVGTGRFDNFFAFQRALVELFDRPVDLVEPGGLRNPYFIQQVNETRRPIYAAS
jgi:uncharacterized protein